MKKPDESLTSPTGNHNRLFSRGLIELKAWIEVKSQRFSYLHPILYLVVMEFGVKPVIPGTFPIGRFWGGERARRV
ncbi:hypothetical protein ACFL2S_14950, partial [Thermodesulfobacteriota bacterium]